MSITLKGTLAIFRAALRGDWSNFWLAGLNGDNEYG